MLVEVGAAGAPPQVLHAYRLRNTAANRFGRAAVEARRGAASTCSGGGGGGIGDPAPRRQRRRRWLHAACSARRRRLRSSMLVKACGRGHRQEDALWQVDLRTVPEAGCVDMKSLGGLISVRRLADAPRSSRAAGTFLAGAVDGQSPHAKPRRRNSSRAVEGRQRGAAAAAAAAASGEPAAEQLQEQ